MCLIPYFSYPIQFFFLFFIGFLTLLSSSLPVSSFLAMPSIHPAYIARAHTHITHSLNSTKMIIIYFLDMWQAHDDKFYVLCLSAAAAAAAAAPTDGAFFIIIIIVGECVHCRHG